MKRRSFIVTLASAAGAISVGVPTAAPAAAQYTYHHLYVRDPVVDVLAACSKQYIERQRRDVFNKLIERLMQEAALKTVGVRCINLSSMSDEEYEAYHQALVKAKADVDPQRFEYSYVTVTDGVVVKEEPTTFEAVQKQLQR